ncbi:MAG TPA: hypothetical protein VNS58_00815 [Puia sp.]|nr:hypothetical protein [Puia sp.]
MANSLTKDIEDAIGRETIDCDFIPDENGTQLIIRLAEKFSFEIKQLFMWANKNPAEVYDYQKTPNQWEHLLLRSLANFSDRIFLVVTNEDFFPWKVLDCKKDNCIKLLTELPYFEYFIFDDSMDYVLFDTHDNALILFHSNPTN